MELAVRSFAQAGVIALSASAIALTPLAPSVSANHLSPLSSTAVSNVAVQLTGAFNPLQPWIDGFQTAGANAKVLGQTFFEAPAVLLQQFLANQVSHVGTILRDPGSIGAVLKDVGHNVQSAIREATLLGTAPDDWTMADSNDVWHGLVAQMLPNMLPTAGNPQASAFITQVVNVLASPLSGILMGLVGPAVSPVVALVNSITAIGNSLLHGDLAKAVQTAINIPASVVNGFLNGANLNLDALAPLITKTMPAGNSLSKLNIQFGGLFTAGTTGMDLSGIGGSILNSLGMIATTDLAPDDPLPITGWGIGPIGALLNFTRLMAKAIGWDGTGNPLLPKATNPAPPAAAAASPSSVPSLAATGVALSAAPVTAPAVKAKRTTRAVAAAADATTVDTAKADAGAPAKRTQRYGAGARPAAAVAAASDSSVKSDSGKGHVSKGGKSRVKRGSRH